MQTIATHRALTNDERRAAEAAFNGLPFDDRWSPSARSVYEGIRTARGEDTTPPAQESPAEVTHDLPPLAGPDPTNSRAPIMTREEAIHSGYLIDVTPIAHSLGLPFPVFLSKPLWEFGITLSLTLPNDQHEARVRDLLMALRLRLATLPIVAPGMAFPALLSFPPEPTPQLCMFHAIAQGDQSVPFSIILLLASEIVTAIRPQEN
jgi:hypothetical protein